MTCADCGAPRPPRHTYCPACHAIRFSRRRADGATHEGKLEIATCPGDARKVARVYGVSVRHVYSMREWARRHGIEA